MTTLGLIVEGHGDVHAVPILVRRIAEAMDPPVWGVSCPSPLRLPRGRIVKETELGKAVELMARRAGAHGPLLIVLDAEDDCAATLAPRLLKCARERRSDRLIEVVVAVREFETWFLAAGSSLNIAAPNSPEQTRDAKGVLRTALGRYSETVDQPTLTAKFDLASAQSRSRSMDKMVRAVKSLLRNSVDTPAP